MSAIIELFSALTARAQAPGGPEPVTLADIQPAPRVRSGEGTPRRRARGKAGTVITSGLVHDDESNTELTGEKWYGSPGRLGIAAKMMRDPHVRRSVDYIADPLCSALWLFRAASNDPIDREVADFCRWAFIERLAWRQVLRRVVRGYAAAGFHFEEMTDDLKPIPTSRFPNHPGEGMGIIPTGFHDRPAWTLHRWFQSNRNSAQLAAIQQFTIGSDRERAGIVTIPSDRLIRFTYDQEGAYFPGMSILRSAYQPWKLKIAFLSFDAVKHERTGLATPSITLAEDAAEEDIAAAETIAAEMRVNEKGFIVLPNGYTFEWVGAGESDSSNLDAAITRCNIDIAYNVAAGFMLLSLAPGSTGSHALAGTQQGAYHWSIDSQAAFVADAFNVGQDGWSPIERIVQLNYGPDVAVPRLAATNLPTRDWLATATAVYAGIAAGAITADEKLEDQLRDSLELGPRDPDTSRERPVSLGSPPREPSDTLSRPEPDDDDDDDDEPEPEEDSDNGED